MEDDDVTERNAFRLHYLQFNSKVAPAVIDRFKSSVDDVPSPSHPPVDMKSHKM